tara:strand:+ start:317 stop:490 length:174 start_codon:yes stop_codon:yes gene_type:complete
MSLSFEQIFDVVLKEDENGLLEADVQYVSDTYGLHEDDDREEILQYIAETRYEQWMM